MRRSATVIALSVAINALALSSISLAAADPNGPCEAVAAGARSVPPKAWSEGVPKALQPILSIDRERSSDVSKSPLEQTLTRLPWVRAALANADGNWTEFVSHMPGTDVYMVSTYQGSLQCQVAVFVQAAAGSKPSQIEDPKSQGEEECWTKSGALGAINGAPAFIEGGAENDHTFDTSYIIEPWTGSSWGPACRVKLRFSVAYQLAARHCGAPAVCREAARLAVKLAADYGEFQRRPVRRGGAIEAFDPQGRSGAAPPELLSALTSSGPPPFSRFGDKDQTMLGGGFSDNGFSFFPLRMAGAWYVGAIGYEGVGWRESDRTLLEVFSAGSRLLKPEASFELQAVNTGFADVTVSLAPDGARR